VLADDVIERAGIALAAVGAELVSAEAESALAGNPPSAELFETAGRAAAAASKPVTDQRGSAEYKRHVSAVLTRRALSRAAARAGGEPS
jgi:carbon-monoxide dehydrogenase medium subunit